MFFRYRVERPQAGQARIYILGPDGLIIQEHLETDAAKADAMTDAPEAEGKLGIDIGIGG